MRLLWRLIWVKTVCVLCEYEGKWAIILGLTSNKGASDFELKQLISENGEEHLRAEFLYERVLRTVSKWGNLGNLMFVVGATQAEEFVNIREIIPEHFLLVPGVGAQGGSLKDISEKAMNIDCGLLVNASRAIIYASEKEDFAEEAKAIAEQYQFEMKGYLPPSPGSDKTPSAVANPDGG